MLHQSNSWHRGRPSWPSLFLANFGNIPNVLCIICTYVAVKACSLIGCVLYESRQHSEFTTHSWQWTRSLQRNDEHVRLLISWCVLVLLAGEENSQDMSRPILLENNSNDIWNILKPNPPFCVQRSNRLGTYPTSTLGPQVQLQQCANEIRPLAKSEARSTSTLLKLLHMDAG